MKAKLGGQEHLGDVVEGVFKDSWQTSNEGSVNNGMTLMIDADSIATMKA